MPELPEVEVSRLGIQPHLVQQTIAHIIVRDDRLRWPVPETIKQIKDSPILGLCRPVMLPSLSLLLFVS